MDRAEKTAAIAQRLARARDDLEIARLALSGAKWRGAVNRAYYKVFHVASAALLWHDEQRSKHSGVQSAFSALLIKPGKIEPEFGKIYSEARRLREDQDYLFESEPLTETDARRIVGEAERFLERLTRYLREAGALEEGT